MKIEVSNGEILDKICILQIKQSRIRNLEKWNNVNKELNTLLSIVSSDENFMEILSSSLYSELYSINYMLWDVEDNIRKKESEMKFDDEFIRLARLVYKLNDDRAQIKRRVNVASNSDLIEEKEYQS